MSETSVGADVQELNLRFGMPGVATVEAGNNGMPRVAVKTPAAEGQVYLHGAHVTHYHPAGQAEPVLFMSAESLFDPAKAIRGGVPLIFPWFGGYAANPKAPAHGVARTSPWALRSVERAGDAVTVALALGPNDASRKWWPHEFEATFRVTFGRQLEMSLAVRNTSPAPFSYEEALHTYLVVGDVRKASTAGLAGRAYVDKVEKMARKTQGPEPIVISGETDRVYLDTPDAVTVTDPVLGRRLVVEKQGSASTIVWNPWVEKSRSMSDFGDDEWPVMLCVETANAAENAVRLAPGAEHVMRATVRAEAQ